MVRSKGPAKIFAPGSCGGLGSRISKGQPFSPPTLSTPAVTEIGFGTILYGSRLSAEVGIVAARRCSVDASAFGSLTERLNSVWATLKDEDDLSLENAKVLLRARRALLEADVSLPVVRRFIKNIEQKAIGTRVTKGVQRRTAAHEGLRTF